MLRAREELLSALQGALAKVAPGHATTPAFETPRQATLGDLACTVAMPLARALKQSPRAIAASLVEALQGEPAVVRWVDRLEIAGPGFLNLFLKPAALQSVVTEVLEQGPRFGHRAADATAGPVLVEFVSANPTGPLHVGHTRQAALGDAICRLLESQGRRVDREFYYNDAGVQIENLARSVKARLDGLAPGEAGWPEAAYNGEYIADIARAFREGRSVAADDRSVTASGDVDDLDAIRAFAVAYLRHEQDLDLRALGVRFDRYYLESSLYSSGRVAQAVDKLVASGKTYEHEGALWLRSTDYGDDKDRVMRKSDGGYTYFVPDVAYHLAKWERGYAQAINIQGTDHHGTIARVRAGLQAAGEGVPAGYPDYILHTMVRVERGGVEVKLSKRAGSYVTLRDLVEWTSADAVRFLMLTRKADTEFTFDVDLAVRQSDDNPVFYVQYAHARMCSVLEQQRSRGQAVELSRLVAADLSPLVAATESTLLRKLAEWPEVLADAATQLAPHEVTFYLRDVASAFHSWYAAERILVDDAALADARLALLAAARQVLQNGLGMLGVSAPQRLERESPVPA